MVEGLQEVVDTAERTLQGPGGRGTAVGGDQGDVRGYHSGRGGDVRGHRGGGEGRGCAIDEEQKYLQVLISGQCMRQAQSTPQNCMGRSSHGS